MNSRGCVLTLLTSSVVVTGVRAQTWDVLLPAPPSSAVNFGTPVMFPPPPLHLGLAPTNADYSFDCGAGGSCVAVPVTTYGTNFFGDDHAWGAVADCPRIAVFQCAMHSRGDSLVTLDGVGSDTITIDWVALANVDYDCSCQRQGEPESYYARATTSIEANFNLTLFGLPVGTPVTVAYRWRVNSATTYSPEIPPPSPDDHAHSYDTGGEGLRINGVVEFDASFDLIDRNGWIGGEGTGTFVALVGTPIPIGIRAAAEASIQPPPKNGITIVYDSESARWKGKLVLTVSTGTPVLPPDCSEPVMEFSVDIGGDAELSDPSIDGNERFDPGDMYLAGGPPLPPGGMDGVRDDALIFTPIGSEFDVDPYPDPPDGPAVTGAPACDGGSLAPAIANWFDLDGSDSIDFSLADVLPAGALSSPILISSLPVETRCIFLTEDLIVSFDDDGPAHYVGNAALGCQVPVTSTSSQGRTYGSAEHNDEIVGLTVIPGSPPLAAVTWAMGSETAVHPSLAPNPAATGAQDFDDDVDALNVTDGVSCNFWLFSFDHEATGKSWFDAFPGPRQIVDPGDIYGLPRGGGRPIRVIDDVIHLGIADSTDIKDFELVRMFPELTEVDDVLALLFIVSEDDPLTTPDESGGLDPKMIYFSFLTGASFPLLAEPLEEVLDALANWCEPFSRSAPLPPPACGDGVIQPSEECDPAATPGGCVPPSTCQPDCTCTDIVPPPVIVWDPATSPTPWPNNNPLATTRSLRFTVSPPVTATGTPGQDAIKVTMVDLQNPVPPNLPCCPPPNFSAYESATCTASGEMNGCARWVGKPGTFLECQDNPGGGNYRAARLQCDPVYLDWVTETAAGPITVVGAEIVPSSTYSVQAYSSTCKGMETGCTNVSPAVAMFTRRYGDVEAPYNPPSPTTQPNVIDVAQLVNKFKCLPGALSKAIAQIQPNVPELNADVNALDIVAVVNAVLGLAYPFSGPCPCPSAVPCGPAMGSVACTTATPCVTAFGAGALCVKTCTGGANAGDPCINNTHCPTSTCGAGFCRDRCGRCTP